MTSGSGIRNGRAGGETGDGPEARVRLDGPISQIEGAL
ncbi:hypothetical protein C8J29_102625 [Cereibacter johrii]|uniref:Uncharacterized protein n=1 Tax=Cereibacter johrii TaxID=445629 RepID=A0ABX5JAR8_9RHOB|nr:hypothetical protein C8J29_102625 [Cereibacter johrii]